MKSYKLRNSNIAYFLVKMIVICLSLLLISPNLDLQAKKKTTKSKTTKTKSSRTKTKSKSGKAIKSKSSSKKSKSKKSRRKKRVIEPPSHTFVQDTLLAPGIVYKRAHIKINGYKHDVLVLQADLSNPYCSIGVFKAGDNINELSKLCEIMKVHDSINPCDIAGAVNANFWKAYTNYPIGPVVVDGEVIELPTYKDWSSTFIAENGEPFIDNFRMNGTFKNSKGKNFNINLVNRRSDTCGIVMYNKFGGDTIPYINSRRVKQLTEKSIENIDIEESFNDSTEAAFDLEKYKKELIASERSASKEYKIPKLILRYLDKPAINRNIECKVIGYDTSAVKVPFEGCILSLGADFNMKECPKIGDTVSFVFKSNTESHEKFRYAVSGTPRLVRDGVAQHEARKEGSRGRRFINGNLPRTAIGYDRAKKKMFIVAVRGSIGKDGIEGASLAQLSAVMKYIGCHNAMNLDGGGSSIMVIDNKNMFNDGDPSNARRISVGFGLIKKCASALKSADSP